MIDARDRERLKAMVAGMHLERIFSDLDYLTARLEQFATSYAAKTATTPAPFPKTASVVDLLAEYDRNPYRVKALLQAVAFKCSPKCWR